MARPLCNGHKSDKTHAIDPETGQLVPLFNPRTQSWFEHFRWTSDGLRIVGLSPIGRATVAALHLDDDPDALEVRSYWMLAGPLIYSTLAPSLGPFGLWLSLGM